MVVMTRNGIEADGLERKTQTGESLQRKNGRESRVTSKCRPRPREIVIRNSNVKTQKERKGEKESPALGQKMRHPLDMLSLIYYGKSRCDVNACKKKKKLQK